MVKDLLQRSHRATCGTFERELTINPKNISKVKARLKNAGFRIVGTSERKDKVWFVKPGLALL